MRISYQPKHLMNLTMGVSIAALSVATMGSWLAAPGNYVAATVAATLPVTQRSAPFTTDAFKGLDDYQPPDNGGPSRTGGSGTRWRSAMPANLSC